MFIVVYRLSESSAKYCLGCQFGSPGLVWRKIQEPLTQVENLLGVKGVKMSTNNHSQMFLNLLSNRALVASSAAGCQFRKIQEPLTHVVHRAGPYMILG